MRCRFKASTMIGASYYVLALLPCLSISDAALAQSLTVDSSNSPYTSAISITGSNSLLITPTGTVQGTGASTTIAFTGTITSASLTNEGTIINDTGAGFDGLIQTTSVTAGNITIANTGTITNTTSKNSGLIVLTHLPSGTDVIIDNSGTINQSGLNAEVVSINGLNYAVTSPGAAIAIGPAANTTLNNSGTIIGDIGLASGTNTLNLTTGSTIQGAVYPNPNASANTTVNLSGTGSGIVFGTSETPEHVPSGYDTFYGMTDISTMNVNSGNWSLIGEGNYNNLNISSGAVLNVCADGADAACGSSYNGKNGTPLNGGLAPLSTTLAIANNGQLNLYSDSTDNEISYDATQNPTQIQISGTGSILDSGAGTDYISPTSSITQTSVELSGDHTVIDAGTINSAVTIDSGSTLEIGSGGSLTNTYGNIVDNNTTGSLTGNVTDNGLLIFNVKPASGPVQFSGNITGSGALAVNNSLVLTGANAYTGGTTIASGASLQIGNGGTSGTLPGNVGNNGTLVFDRSDAVTYSNVISGTGGVTQAGSGTTILTGVNSYAGTTTISAGTLQIGDGAGSTGAIPGNLVDNGTLIIALPASYTVAGAFSGAGALIDTDPGTLTFAGAYNFTGTTTINGSGSIDVSQLQPAASLNVNSGSVNITGGSTTIAALNGTGGTVNIASGNTLTIGSGNYGGTISGSGSLVVASTGILTLSGTDTVANVAVNSGVLLVNGSLSAPVTVASGATLGGSGQITGQVTVASGGTYSPGDPVTSSVNGKVTFQPGSTYLAQQTPSASDLIAVTGSVAIQPGAVVLSDPLGATSSYARVTDYTIVSATQGVSGTFSGVTSENSALLPYLSYAPDDVTLTLVRSDISLVTIANTANQTAVATAINNDGPSSGIYNLVAPKSDTVAKQSFDLLSGEVHATLVGSLLNDSRFLADEIQSNVASVEQTNVWGSENNRWSNFSNSPNATSAESSMLGFAAGADTLVADGIRVGGALGYSRDAVDVPARTSIGDANTYHLGAYADINDGPLDATFVISEAWHSIGTLREIGFGTFNGAEAAHYTGHTTTIYSELRYREDFDGMFAEPFANISGSNLETSAFTESAGTAALSGSSIDRAVIFTRVGSRFGTTYGFLADGTISPMASVSWEHGSDNIIPREDFTFASGGSSFTVAGAPLDRDAFDTELGLNVKPSSSTALSINLYYAGRIGGAVTENSVNASIRLEL